MYFTVVALLLLLVMMDAYGKIGGGLMNVISWLFGSSLAVLIVFCLVVSVFLMFDVSL